MNTPAEFLDTLDRTMGKFLEMLPVLILTVIPAAILGYMIFELLRHVMNPANRFVEGKAVIAYKGAKLTAQGFQGVSGGGTYGHLEEGELNPGFHTLKDINSLKNSIYGIGADVYLEVLLYGKVKEYQNGYIGSHQRVLQVIFPDHMLYCYRCYSSRAKYFDEERRSSSLTGANSPLICENCKPKDRKRSWRLPLLSRRSHQDYSRRFTPLTEYFEARNKRDGNPQPIGFASSVDELVPTVLPESVSAR